LNKAREPRRTGRTLSLSALGFFVVFAVTAYSGANIVAFERLEGRVGSLRGHLGAVSSWKNTTGVATRARYLALEIVLAETPGDTAAIENALDELAEASPTSVAIWQARVAYEDARGASMKRVLAAFRMSALTGSHEGHYMNQRAIFGLEHWTELPEEDRHTAIRDVLATVLVWDLGYREHRYRTILAAKSEAERGDIRAALTASGLANKEVLQALGM
jgi:hypothetical protein